MNSKVLALTVCTFLMAVVVCSAQQQVESTDDSKSSDGKPQWRFLLTEDLEGWEVYTGVPHESVFVPGFGKSTSEDCRGGKPVGLGDPLDVFTTDMVDGRPVLNVSGQVYAGISTYESFSNYHLSLEYKWGQKKFPPRANQKRDAGLLIHCNGEHGAFWNVWLQSLECQIQESDTGDFIALAGTSAKLLTPESEKGKGMPVFDSEGIEVCVGAGTKAWGAKRRKDFEKQGDWNLVEVYAFNDDVVFLVNGNVVMELADAKIGNQANGEPLTSGRIQLQCEAAELTYRNLKIRDISKMPKLR